jgi:hypothetical protein
MEEFAAELVPSTARRPKRTTALAAAAMVMRRESADLFTVVSPYLRARELR